MRIAGIILILISLVTFAYWAATGMNFITLYEQPKTVITEDDFGDQVETTTMEKDFKFGLNPSDKYYDGALPIGGTAGGLGLVLLIGGVIRKRRALA